MIKIRKKIIAFAFASVVTCFITSTSLSAIGVGVYGGYNRAGLTYNDDVTTAIELLSSIGSDELLSPFDLNSFLVGAYAYIGLIPDFGIPFIPTLAFQVGVAYANKGGTIMSKLGPGETKYTLSSSYIEFPVLLKPRISFFVVDIYALGGVSFSLLQTASISLREVDLQGFSVELEDNLVESQKDSAVKLVNNSLNLNYVVGGGLAYEFLVLFEVFLEVRYSGGLLDIVPSDLPDNSSSDDKRSAARSFYGGSRHSDIYIMAGVGLKI